MVNRHFDIEKLKQMDIVEYLENLGYQPQKIRNNDYWHLSPLREEKEASFKVNRKLNLYYDHGTGRGGKLNRLWNTISQLLNTEISSKAIQIIFFSPQYSFGSTASSKHTRPERGT